MSNKAKVLLLYPPEQTHPDYKVKPNGSLAYPSLAGALLRENIEVAIYDACVGNDKDPIENFYVQTELPNGLLRTGVDDTRILQEVEPYSIVGITSIFTAQETMAIYVAKLIKEAFPEKIIISGGTNARNRVDIFLRNGFDVVAISEAEKTIVDICNAVTKEVGFEGISGAAYRDKDGHVRINRVNDADIVSNLDDLPMPAWELLPMERYWSICRPHDGSVFDAQKDSVKFASIVTSLGCIFKCTYCHISSELKGGMAGHIGRYRVKSIERVKSELLKLRSLGVEHIFIEDDTLLGNKKRALELFRTISSMGLNIYGANGLNLIRMFRSDGTPDSEMIDVLAEAGFKRFSLPFESANQRIIDKYAAGKWKTSWDVVSLIHECKERNIEVLGDWMIGYPDETLEEIYNTIEAARTYKKAGLASVGFTIPMPLPGTWLYTYAIENGYFFENFNPDIMNWTKATMVNTTVEPDVIEKIRRDAWLEINDSTILHNISKA